MNRHTSLASKVLTAVVLSLAACTSVESNVDPFDDPFDDPVCVPVEASAVDAAPDDRAAPEEDPDSGADIGPPVDPDEETDGGGSEVDSGSGTKVEGEKKGAPIPEGKDYSFKTRFDELSQTEYYLTFIRHKDQSGKLLKLQHEHANNEKGETVPQFAKRKKDPLLAINASTMYLDSKPKLIPTGTQIINGKTKQDFPTKNRYTLGIKANNELVAYPFGTSADDMIADGALNALTAFVPLVVDGKPVPAKIMRYAKNSMVAHPRQVIAQFENLDLLILSCGGRGHGGVGMTGRDLTHILLDEGVKFGFMLDGGGSTSTVLNGKLRTPRIDGDGTKDRLRPNFLWIK
jgi:exopolysaccharide biosynthesis protein